MKDNFKAMAESVAKYGGFYVGRYEAGYTADNIPVTGYTSVKGQTVMTANKASANKWYGLYKHLTTNMGVVNSTMIWGCQFDQVINFIGAQAQIGHLDKYLWSSTTEGTTSGFEPANNTKPLDIMKNVYDLEGNYNEWTVEANSMDSRVHRGSYFIFSAIGWFHPASYRGYREPTGTDSQRSSRATLYL